MPQNRVTGALRVFTLCLAGLAIATPVLAAGAAKELTAAVPTVRQEDLVRAALTRLPAIVSARRSVEANTERLEASRGAYLPQLSLNAGLSRSNATTASSVSDPFNLSSASVGVHQELVNFGKTAAQVDAATATLEASRGTLRVQAVEIAHQVRRAYIGWVQARALEAQAQGQVNEDQRLYDAAVAFFKAGTRARLDVTRAQVTLQQARAALLAAHTATDQARAALATAIGERRLIEGTPTFADIPEVSKRPLDHLRALALENHPLLATAQARVAQARALREAAEAADRPDIGADATYGARARDLQGASSWNFGLNLAWPLYNGGAFEHQREASRLTEAAAVADERTQADQVVLNVENAYLGIAGAAARLPATNAELASARENLFQAEGRYRAGVGSIIEVSDAQALLVTAESDRLRAEAAYHLAIADLIAAVGLTGTEP